MTNLHSKTKNSFHFNNKISKIKKIPCVVQSEFVQINSFLFQIRIISNSKSMKSLKRLKGFNYFIVITHWRITINPQNLSRNFMKHIEIYYLNICTNKNYVVPKNYLCFYLFYISNPLFSFSGTFIRYMCRPFKRNFNKFILLELNSMSNHKLKKTEMHLSNNPKDNIN